MALLRYVAGLARRRERYHLAGQLDAVRVVAVGSTNALMTWEWRGVLLAREKQ